MDDLAFDYDQISFDVETLIEKQTLNLSLSFIGMDKIFVPLCMSFLNNGGFCNRGLLCPYRHNKGDKSVVCKHWLRGMCRKGDDCEFQHEFDSNRMPSCYFYSKYGQCSNKECPFIHSDVEFNSKHKECPWYDRGFCKHGPSCRLRHIKKTMCTNYLCGFCPLGPNCTLAHPKFDIPATDDMFKKTQVVCHACGEPGHKSTSCPIVENYRDKARLEGHMEFSSSAKRPIEQVTCFKCREKGHYANKCPYSLNEIQKMRKTDPNSTETLTT